MRLIVAQQVDLDEALARTKELGLRKIDAKIYMTGCRWPQSTWYWYDLRKREVDLYDLSEWQTRRALDRLTGHRLAQRVTLYGQRVAYRFFEPDPTLGDDRPLDGIPEEELPVMPGRRMERMMKEHARSLVRDKQWKPPVHLVPEDNEEFARRIAAEKAFRDSH